MKSLLEIVNLILKIDIGKNKENSEKTPKSIKNLMNKFSNDNHSNGFLSSIENTNEMSLNPTKLTQNQEKKIKLIPWKRSNRILKMSRNPNIEIDLSNKCY